MRRTSLTWNLRESFESAIRKGTQMEVLEGLRNLPKTVEPPKPTR